MKFVLAVLVAAAMVFGALIVCYAIGRWICGDADDLPEDDVSGNVIIHTIEGVAVLGFAAMIVYVLYMLGSEVIFPMIGIK